MSPQELTEILKNHRSTKARFAYLSSQVGMLERFLKICRSEMIEDQVTMSQSITGMPHGTTVGDPTARLALDIASGKVTPFVEQIEAELTEVHAEMNRIGPKLAVVECVMGAVNEREWLLIEMKAIDGLSWAEILKEMNQRFNGVYSKRSLQRLYDRAFSKALEIVK